jgi:predicted alpha/beta-fold hydrolase
VHPDEFTPACWLPGPHAQTLEARILRSRPGVRLRDERIELADGDFLDLSWVQPVPQPGNAAGPPLVLVLHGFEGSARSKYALEIYRAQRREGLAPLGSNFRS